MCYQMVKKKDQGNNGKVIKDVMNPFFLKCLDQEW